MQKEIKIDVISDINCPWCYLGENRLKKATEATNGKYDFKLHHKPFELNPNAPPEGEEKETYFLRNYGPEALKHIEASSAHITEMGKKEGLVYKFDKQVKIYNTFNAHRLIWLAGKYQVQDQVTNALYRYNFTEGRDLNDIAFLKQVGIGNGIPAGRLEGFFESEEGKEEVKMMEFEAHQAGITGVPAFILNDKYLIKGAQSTETFLQAFAKLAAET